MSDGEFQDHYEVLQLSATADPDTIHRVYRLLAQRFHPDNRETGDGERFQVVHEAYRVLSDPEIRARFDVAYNTRRAQRWRLFGEGEHSADAFEFERRTRLGILGLLYTKRRADSYRPAMNLIELEELLGIPREHLEFSAWFLREKQYITLSDESAYKISAEGVEYVEEHGAAKAVQKLLHPRRDKP